MHDINSWIIGGMIIAYAIVIYRQFALSEQNKDLWSRLRAEREAYSELDGKLNIEQGLRRGLEGALADERTKLHQANESLADMTACIGTLKREKGDLGIQVMALCKDVESLRTCNNDLHRVIDMDAKKLKEKDRQLAEQQVKIDKLMKVRKR